LRHSIVWGGKGKEFEEALEGHAIKDLIGIGLNDQKV